LAKARQAEMDRITGGAGTAAASSQGGRASAEYGAKVASLIRSHTVFNVPNGLSGNPPVEYAVDLLPDGSLRGTPRKLKSSGVLGFDEAVLRAIEKSQPFPRDERSGNVPSSFTVSHKPKDQ
jgi:colicin import membrane protein